eukprot:scaffold819_cov350-Prasinococcus_capsulatus_cf.AAC.2
MGKRASNLRVKSASAAARRWLKPYDVSAAARASALAWRGLEMYTNSTCDPSGTCAERGATSSPR